MQSKPFALSPTTSVKVFCNGLMYYFQGVYWTIMFAYVATYEQ